MEADHLDHHGTVDAYTKVFDDFVGRIEPGGVLIACADDPGSAALADRAERAGVRVRRYGFTASGAAATRCCGTSSRSAAPATSAPAAANCPARWTVQDIACGLRCPASTWRSTRPARCWPGLELGAPLAGLLDGLAAFGGVRRRFEFKGRSGKVRVYDDYAHNPTKVAAQLKATRLVSRRRPADRDLPAAPVLPDQGLRRRVRPRR